MDELQQGSALPVVVSQPEQGMQLNALLQHQAIITMQVVGAEGELRSTRTQMEGLAGSDRVAQERHLRELEASIRGMKADLDETRSKIRELRSQDMEQDAHVGMAVVQEADRIFTLKPAEFYGATGFVLLLPIVFALAHRIWRGGPARSKTDKLIDGSERATRLEQAVDSIAVEVERISEAQRFAAKLLAERPVEPVIERVADPSRSKRRVVTPLP